METIDDIVREMREGVVAKSWFEQTLKEFADRIEKAARHEMSDEFSAEIQKLTDELYEVKKENARLKAALQPVLDIVMDSATSDLSMELAITEVKRIWKEGEK